MKKTYVTPNVEKVAFQYRDQVVVASAGIEGSCERIFRDNTGEYGSQCWTNEYRNNNR